MEVLWLPEMLGKALFDAFKNLCFFIDNIVYSFIPQLYKMILYLSNVDLYSSSDTIKALMNRIYILVGIFMLFKLSFSMIKYVADPNAFSDQSKGFTNLVKNSIIALFLLVTIPWMFQKAYEIQGVILTSNIVPNLIMGTDTEQIDINNMESSAKDIQFLMFGPFFSINTDIDSLKACEPSDEHSLSNIIGTTDMALKENCLESFSNAMNEDENVRSTNTTLDKFFRTSDDPNEDKRNFGSLASLITWSKDDKSVINYLPVASTLCGGYLVFLLLTFCIDIAGRAIKLMFLQVLSPVAVVSSIDPTESSQNGKLKEWLKECIKTFASVFVRLAILFFVIEMIKVITEVLFATASGKSLYYQGNLPSPSGALNVFIYIFLIIGSFQVAKKIPELLEKALGVKFSGEINMNPFKNPVIAGATGMAVGAAFGGMAGLKAGVEAGAPIRGALGGVATGIGKGRSEKLGLGMASNIRRKTYKDMTGSDIKTFNPWQKVYGYGGKKKVDAEKEYRNKAYGQMNDLDTELNMVSHRNAKNYDVLRSNGINVKTGTDKNGFTIDDRRNDNIKKQDRMNEVGRVIKQKQTVLSAKQQAMEQGKNKVDDINQRIKNINSQLNNKNRIIMSDGSNSDSNLKMLRSNLESQLNSEEQYLNNISKEIESMETDISSNKSEYDKLSAAITNNNNVITAYDEYVKGVNKENELRKERSAIEKDISVINDQISDLTTFYQIDESSKQSLSDAKNNILKRENEKK